MKRRNFAHRPGCAVEATLDLIDGKWKGVILFHLHGTQIARRMPDYPAHADQAARALRTTIIRKVYAEVPPRVGTPVGDRRKLAAVIDTLRLGRAHQELLCAGAATAYIRGLTNPPGILS